MTWGQTTQRIWYQMIKGQKAGTWAKKEIKSMNDLDGDKKALELKLRALSCKVKCQKGKGRDSQRGVM